MTSLQKHIMDHISKAFINFFLIEYTLLAIHQNLPLHKEHDMTDSHMYNISNDMKLKKQIETKHL